MALSIVRDSGAVQMADILVFSARRTRNDELFGSDALSSAREQYLDGHPKRMERIRRLALAALEREEREKAGGAGGD